MIREIGAHRGDSVRKSERSLETPSREVLRFFQLFESIGVPQSRFSPAVTERVDRLDEKTHTLKDEIRCVEYGRRIAEALEFNPAEWARFVGGTLLSDIGKTGPADALPEEQEYIAQLYARDRVANSKTIRQYLKETSSGDAPVHEQVLARAGVLGDMPIRKLWESHVQWTFDILTASDLPADVILSASSHHLLEGINPGNILNREEGRFQAFGVSREFDRADILVILLDKYDAQILRANATHEEAVDYLRERLDTNEYLPLLPPHLQDAFYRIVALIETTLKKPIDPSGKIE